MFKYIIDLIKRLPLPMLHPEGVPFVLLAAIIALGLNCMHWMGGVLGLGLTAFVYYFFRNPKRSPPSDPNVLLSPADGRISQIEQVPGPAELGLQDQTYTRVSVYMNVFNCHVNRLPSRGTIERVVYVPGKFLHASLDKASVHNERNYVQYQTNFGHSLVLVQIAGLIARRIVCKVQAGDTLNGTDEIGIIRFGSRVDVYLQDQYELTVNVGQKTIAGQTQLGQLKT